MDCFRKVSMEDRDRLRDILLGLPDRGCEYTFGNIYIWKDVYETEIMWNGGTAAVRFGSVTPGCLYPMGPDVEGTVKKVLSDGTDTFVALREEDCSELERLFPGKFTFSDMGLGEYVYNSSDLIELKGKKFHGQRNHISKFVSEHPDYSFREIDRDSIDSVRKMDLKWVRQNDQSRSNVGIEQEASAVNLAFDNFFELGFKGGYIETETGIVAFSMGEPINSETFCTHIEKAYHSVNGAYNVINRDFAKHFCSGYKYINREDDAGAENLREAKMMLHPAFVTKKFRAVYGG